MKWMAASAFLIGGLSSSACEAPGRVHEGKAKVVRTFVNRRDEKGDPLVTDVELSLQGCAGELRMVARGGAPFAACVANTPVGADVSIKVSAGRTRDGRRATRLVAVGECRREDDPTDSRSYESFRACEILKTDEIVVGFRCEVTPTDAAKRACPWLGP